MNRGWDPRIEADTLASMRPGKTVPLRPTLCVGGELRSNIEAMFIVGDGRKIDTVKTVG